MPDDPIARLGFARSLIGLAYATGVRRQHSPMIRMGYINEYAQQLGQAVILPDGEYCADPDVRQALLNEFDGVPHDRIDEFFERAEELVQSHLRAARFFESFTKLQREHRP